MNIVNEDQLTFQEAFWKEKILLTDSRNYFEPQQTIFFALRGDNFDGEDFIDELYQKGIRYFVCSKPLDHLSEAVFIISNDPLCILQALVQEHRKCFSTEVIGITGSNGKTIVKEWLFQVLAAEGGIVKSPKSYNSQLGVPLSVWQLKATHHTAIFEAGISKVGEMELIAPVIAPQVGIFTNIGDAHQAGFSSLKNKIEEKLKLFHTVKYLIYCSDHSILNQSIESLLQDVKLLSWGKDGTFAKVHQRGDVVTFLIENQEFKFEYPFQDAVSVENLNHVVIYLLWKGKTPQFIQDRIGRIKSLPLRLEIKSGVYGSILISDVYNNDLSGLTVALSFLSQHSGHKSKVLILSEMHDQDLIRSVVLNQIDRLLQKFQIDELIFIGDSIEETIATFSVSLVSRYASIDEFEALYEKKSLQDKAILVKGARNYAFEQLVGRLQEKSHRTVLEINLDSLTNNLSFYRSLLKPTTKLMAMVKALGYGSGAIEIARLLENQGIDYLAVAYVDEGVFLRTKGINLPIMVMNTSMEDFDQLYANNLEPEVFSVQQIKGFKQKAQESSIVEFPIHIKLETGMNRLGFNHEELQEVLPVLGSGVFQVKSIFSHLAASDMPEEESFTLSQFERFKTMKQQIQAVVGKEFLSHILNSGGITRYPTYQMDMVRLGIGLYGVEVNGLYQYQVESVSTLKASISKIRKVAKGETVGYSRKGAIEQDTRIAVVSIGYADGYDRRFGNGKGQMVVNGHLVPVVGNVCMDMTMLDLGDIPAIEGDEVIVFGVKPSVSYLANRIGTIPYELLTNVSERVKRVYYSG